MNKFFLSGLIFCSPIVASALHTSGQIWLEALTQTYQHTAEGLPAPKDLRPAERWDLTRVDLNLSYQATDSWSLQSRVGFNHSNSSELRSDLPMQPLPWSQTLRLRQFYGRYTSFLWGQVEIGRFSVPQISATSSSPSVFGIDPNRYHIITAVSDKPGIGFEKDFGAGVLQITLWQQTPEHPISAFAQEQIAVEGFADFAQGGLVHALLPTHSFHHRALNLGFNTVVHYYPVDTPSAAVAFNIGFQSRPLSRPLVFGVLAQEGDLETAQNAFSAYNALSESSFNIVSYMGRLVFEAQAQYQVLGLAHFYQYGEANPTEQAYRDIFLSDGYGVGYNATVGYHFQGGSYKLHRSSGQLLRQGSGWDIGISYGGVITHNALALASVLGQQDYQSKIFAPVPGGPEFLTGAGRVAQRRVESSGGESYDYIAVDARYPREDFDEVSQGEGFNRLQAQEPFAFQTHSKTYTLYLNYAYNEHLVYQIECEQTQRFNKMSNNLFDSIIHYHAPLNAKAQYLRARVFITF